MATDNEILIAKKGTFILNTTAETTKTINAIVVLEDTIFNLIKIAGVDVKASYISAPGTAVKAGAIIRPTNAQQFSGVRVSSGSVILVL